MTYDQTNERMAFNELYGRWTQFMKYTNHKVKSIPEKMLREYCNFVCNVALRFGSVNAIFNCPEIPNETLGQYVREYEKALVEWSGYLAGIEARERSFREGEKAALERKNKDVVEEENCSDEAKARLREPPPVEDSAPIQPAEDPAVPEPATPASDWLAGGGVVEETPAPKKSGRRSKKQ